MKITSFADVKKSNKINYGGTVKKVVKDVGKKVTEMKRGMMANKAEKMIKRGAKMGKGMVKGSGMDKMMTGITNKVKKAVKKY